MHCEIIGSARLFHGDAVEVLRTLGHETVGSVLTDPPYSSGNFARADRALPTSQKYMCFGSRAKYPEFDGDCKDQRSYFAWSTLWLLRARSQVRKSAICCVFSDWRQLPVTTDAMQAAGWVWRGIVPWDKTESARPQRGRYRNQAEYVVWGTNGARPLVGGIAPGVIRAKAPTEKQHIAGKPISIMIELLQIMDGPILDPFMGSGTIGVACARRNVAYIGVESNKIYFDIACERIRSALL